MIYGDRFNIQNCRGWHYRFNSQSSIVQVWKGRTGYHDNTDGPGGSADYGGTKNIRAICACKIAV